MLYLLWPNALVKTAVKIIHMRASIPAIGEMADVVAAVATATATDMALVIVLNGRPSVNILVLP